jgi:CTP synthase (UTP-ammonia lyase)
MSLRPRIALVGDYNSSVPAHQAIPVALDLASAHLGVEIVADWFPTAKISCPRDLARYQGIWCVPASPYESTQGALDAIQWAREQQVPFLGTCAGFQHALIEYARNVLGMTETDHAETNPEARQPLIAPLRCSLVETQEEVFLAPGSLLHNSYRTLRVREGYRCSYGPNPEREATLFAGKLHVTARDTAAEVRGGELHDHPFFVGTLFQPERRALNRELPPLVRDFVAVVVRRKCS